MGGAISPDKVSAPSIGDAQQQTSQAGMPIPKCLGHSQPIAPTLIDGDKIARKTFHDEQQGKGGGPVVEDVEGFVATRAFLVCEGPIEGFARIYRNGKLVYSTQAGDSLEADSAAWASQVTFYYGTETQGPDPSLEALHGVGNTPYYRGRAYFVVRDDNETDTRGAANQYRVEVISAGTTDTGAGDYAAKTFVDNSPWNAKALTLRDPRWPSMTYEYAFIPNGDAYDDASIDWRATVDEALDDAATATGRSQIDEPELMGWSMSFDEGTAAPDIAPWADLSAESWSDRYVLGLRYSRYTGATESAIVLEPDACGNFPSPVWGANINSVSSGTTLHTNATIQNISGAPADYDDQDFCDNGGGPLVNEYNIYTGYTIACRPTLQCGANLIPNDAVQMPDSTDYYIGTDGTLYGGMTFASVAGTFKQLSTLETDYDPPTGSTGAQITYFPVGPVLASGDANYSSQAYWDAQYAIYQTAGILPAGMTYSATGLGGIGTYPRQTSSACQITTAVPIIDADEVMWKDVVTEISDRCNSMLPAHLDIAHMTDGIPGFVLGNAGLTGADYIRTLCTFGAEKVVDLVEYDDQLHAIRRGAAVAGTLDPDDLYAIEDEDDDLRGQAIAAPARVTLIYPDPANKYVATPQTAPRFSPDVSAASEVNIECPIPFSADQMIRKADIMQKIAFLPLEGKIKRAFPAEYDKYVPSDAVMFDNRRYLITRKSSDDIMVQFEATYDRASAYTSTMTGTNAPTPTAQTSNLKGPTVSAFMNLASLRAADNTPGIYAAVRGISAGWPGCDIYLSVDGGVTEQKVMRITAPATMGILVDDFSIGGSTLTVNVYGTDVLETVTADQIAARANAFAIITDDVAEVGQFQTSAENSGGDYDLTDLTMGQLETDEADHSAGDPFVMLDGAVHIPIDPVHSGKTLYLRPVTIGTALADNAVTTLVFDPPTFVIDAGTSLS